MFGTSTFGGTALFGASATTTTNHNPMKDIEVPSPPDDSVSVLSFSPGALPTTFLAAGSWDNNVGLVFTVNCVVVSVLITVEISYIFAFYDNYYLVLAKKSVETE